MNEKQYLMGNKAGQVANPAPKNKINKQTAQDKTQYGSDFTGYTYTDGKTGQQFQFTSQAADWMRRAYQSQFDSYYAKDAADQASKASGAMPRSFVQSYTKSKADQQLYEMGLPSAKWLGKYLGDYETWRGDGKVVDLDGNPDAKKYVQDQWRKSWKYSNSMEDLRRKEQGLMPEAVEEKFYAKGGKKYGLTKSFASQYYLENGLPDEDELGGFLAGYADWDAKKKRIDQFYSTVSLAAMQAEIDDGVRDDDNTYAIERRGTPSEDGTPGKLEYDKITGRDYYSKLFYDTLNKDEWSDVREFLQTPHKVPKEVKHEDYATEEDFQAALIKAQQEADALKKGEPDPDDPYSLLVSADGWRDYYGADKTGWRARVSAMQASEVFKSDTADAIGFTPTGTVGEYVDFLREAGIAEREARILQENYESIKSAQGRKKAIASVVGTLLDATIAPVTVVNALMSAGYKAKDMTRVKDAILSRNPDNPELARQITDAIAAYEEERAKTAPADVGLNEGRETAAISATDAGRTAGKTDDPEIRQAVTDAWGASEAESLYGKVTDVVTMLKDRGVDADGAARYMLNFRPSYRQAFDKEGHTVYDAINSVYGETEKPVSDESTFYSEAEQGLRAKQRKNEAEDRYTSSIFSTVDSALTDGWAPDAQQALAEARAEVESRGELYNALGAPERRSVEDWAAEHLPEVDPLSKQPSLAENPIMVGELDEMTPAIGFGADGVKAYVEYFAGQHLPDSLIESVVGQYIRREYDRGNLELPEYMDAFTALMDGMEARRGDLYAKVVDIYRDQWIADGNNPFDFDNSLRRQGMERYIPDDVAARDYAIYGGGLEAEMTPDDLQKLMSLPAEEQIAMKTGIVDGMDPQAWADYVSSFVETSAVNPAIHHSIGESITTELAGRGLLRVGLGIANGAFSLVDMASGLVGLEFVPAEWTRDALAQVTALNAASDEQSRAAQYANVGMNIAEQLGRMYFEHGLGTMVADNLGWAGKTFGSGEGLSRFINWSAHKLLNEGAALPFIAEVMGNNYSEARQAGETPLASALYAIPTGFFEGVTESWNTDEWFAKGLGGKRFAQGILNDSKRFTATGTKGFLILNSLLSSFGGEFVEEAASNFMGWVMKGLTWSGGFDEHKFSVTDMLYEGLIGGLTGFIGAGLAAPSTSVQSSVMSLLTDSPQYRDSIMDVYFHDKVYGPISEEQRAAYRARGMSVLTDAEFSAAQHDLFQARQNADNARKTYDQTVSYEQGKLDKARSVEQAKQAAWDALEQNRADTPEWQAEFAKATQALATARNDAQKAQSDFDAHVAAAWDTYTASRTQNERAAAKAQDRLNAHSVYLRDLMYSRMESLPAYTRSAENARNAEGIRSQAEQTLNANADTIADVSFGDIDAASENIMATAELNRNRDALRLKWEDAMREIDEIRRAAGAGTLEQYLAGREDMRAQAEEVLRLAWGSDNLGADMQWAMDFVRAEQLYAADRAAGMDDAQARANYDMRVRAADVELNDRIRAGNRAEQTAKQPTGRPLTDAEWNKTLKSMTAQYTKSALTNGTEQMGQAFDAYKQAVRSGRDVYTTVRLNEVLYDAKNGKAYEAPMTEEQAQAARANTETESAPAETTEAPAAQASETQAAPETQAAQPAASDAVSEIERTPVSEEEKAEVRAFAKKLGRTVVFEDMEDNDSNGYCDANDVIHLNTAQEEHAPDSKDFFKHGVGIVLFHELTHTLEGSKSYGELQDFLLGRGGEHGYIYERAGARGYRESWEAIRGIVLSTPGNENLKGAALDEIVRKEMVAYYLQDVVNTQEFANHLASRKWNLAARIKDWARHQIYKAGFNQGKLGRTEYAAKRALENIEYLYTKALIQNGRKGADGMREHAYGQNLKPYSEAKRASHSNFSMQEAVASYNGAVTTDTDADVSEQDEAPFQMLEGGTLAVRYSNGTWTERDKARLHGEVVAGMENVLRKQDEVVDEARHQQIVEAVQKYINDINSVSARIFANEATLDYTANPDMRVSMLKPNNEYEVTVDASTLCPKRLLYQGTFDAIQKELPNTPLMPDDLIGLVNMMKKRGYVAPCGICYVESRRRWLDKFANDWLSGYTNSSGEWVPPYKGVEGDPYIPTIAELTSSKGYAKLYDTHRPTYYAFADAMNKKGTSNPKVVQMRTEYRNEIAGYTESFVKKLKGIGGIRIQSFSDFEIIHMIDMMQAVMDMAAKGLTAQAYTKVPEFAWIFGGTGIKINLSLIGEGNGLDANGNLIFSSVEGMDFRTAMALRRRYSANVGTILVGINDDHIVAAMGDDRIDFIIPFHKSGWSQEELNKMPELNSYSDYTDYQNERLIVFGKDGKPLRVKNNKKGDNKKAGWYESKSLKDAGLKNYNPVGDGGYWDFEKSGKENAEHYLEMCARDHRLPKFWQFLVDNNDGSFSLPKGDDERSTKIRNGYWKTLTDFKMYDNNGAGAAQRAVLPEFNMAWANKILDDYVKRGGYSMGTDNVTGNEIIYNPAQGDLPVAKDVVDDFVAAYKAAHPGRRYSRGSFSMEEYLRDGRPEQRDRAYEELVPGILDGDRDAIETANRLVRDAARENGFNTPMLYHGTNRFGWTRYNDPTDGYEVEFVYTSTNPAVSANYAGRDNYAGARDIWKGYKGGDAVEDIIDDARSIDDRQYRLATQEERAASFDRYALKAHEIEHKYERMLFDLDDADDFSDDVNETIANYMTIFSWMDGLEYEYVSDESSVEYYRNVIQDAIEKHEMAKDKLRSFFRENEDSLTEKQKQMLEYLLSYDVMDTAIEMNGGVIETLSERPLIFKNGFGKDSFIDASKLRESIDMQRNIGAYKFYGRLGSNPLIVDAGEERYWLSLVVPEMGLVDENGKKATFSTDAVCKWAYRNGYSSVVMKNVVDGGPAGDNYVFFQTAEDKADFASADPITFDDNGNYIPPSQRFQGKRDVRWSRGSFSFDEALKRYRPIEQGMDPRARDIQVPSQASDDTKNSKFYRSFLESHHLPDSWIPAAKEAMQDFAYEPIANDEMADRARDEIARDGGLTYAREKVKAQIEGGQVTALNNAKALQLIAESSERGDYAEAIDLAATLAAAATEAGRAVQIFATLKKMGGAGAAAYWAKIVQRLNVQYDRFIRSGRMQALDLNSPELAPLVQDLTNARTRYEVGVAEDALTKQIGQMLPLTFSEKIRNWRYFAMLANPVTHARNFTGNVLMYGMRGLKDVVASGLETGAQAFGMIDRGDRAHSLSRKDRDAFRAIAKRSYENNSAEIEGENRYAFDVGINRNKRAFQNRLLNRAATFNSDLLGKEDVLFLRWNYFDAYAEYCAGQGFDPDHMSAAERAEAHQFAMDQAQKATFHDASALASWLNKTPAGARLFVEAVMPFKKTPINIAKRGIEYSPAGIVKGIVQAIDVARGAKGSGKYTAAQAIDSLASGFTGSALAALGYFLAKCGLLRAAGEDKEYEEFLEATGSEQTHSLHLDIGGTELSISLAQFAPAMMPMLMGAAWYESASDTGEHLEFGDILDIMSGITNPMMEMSFLSSLNEALKNYSYGKDDSTIGGQIGTVLLTAGKNYVSQFLPTFGQKIADMADPTSRSASGDKTSPLGAQDYYPRQLAKKVPGATYALEPNIDVHGDVVRRDGFWDWALAFANDFVLPGKVKVKERDAVDEALIDIYWATGNTSILPTLPTTKYLQWTVKGEKHKVDMNASQFTQYKSDMGTAYYAAIKEEMRAFDWDRITDEVKADRIEDALKAAKKQVDSLWKEMLGSTVA